MPITAARPQLTTLAPSIARPSLTSARQRLEGLDGLRGLAVLAVVIFHARAFPAGWIGVDLFFALSGFLITTILLDAGATGAPLGACLRPFYARRALRILPLAWAVALLVAALTGEWHGTAWYAAFVVNWHPNPPAPRELGHYWTLAVEEQFYLLWPLVVLCCSRRVLAAACLAIPVVDTLARAVLLRSGWSYATAHVLGNATITRADPLAVGALLAVLYVTHRRIAPRVLWLAVVGAGATLLALLAVVVLAHRLASVQYVLQPALLAVLVGGVLQVVLQAPPRWLSGRALAWLGTRSYGIYVIHGALAPWFVAHVAPVPVRAAGLLAVSVVLAWASWRVLEAPILAEKWRFSMPRAPRCA